MGTPLRISDELVADAKLVGDVLDRSATSQLEHWARLGRAVEAVLGLSEIIRLKQTGASISLDAALAEARSEGGRAKALRHLQSRGRPRYGADPERPGSILRIEPDGTRTRGHFVGRTFVADSEE